MMSTFDPLLGNCLLLDLETTPTGKVLKAGLVFQEESYFLKGKFTVGELGALLDKLACKADFVLGHNVAEHDMKVLRACLPSAAVHRLPLIDTLFLSPVAFPQNPYHHLVKDYRLLRTALNDPVCDARNAGILFQDECRVFEGLREQDEELLQFYAWAFAGMMERLFVELGVASFDDQAAMRFFEKRAGRYGCVTAARFQAMDLSALKERKAAAYALAWMGVAGTGSVLPHWVRHRFAEVGEIVRRMRERGCGDSACAYCMEHHDPAKQLRRFFGFESFRAEPKTADGSSLQEAVVRHGMNEEPLLAILPTGAGKSLCFQVRRWLVICGAACCPS